MTSQHAEIDLQTAQANCRAKQIEADLQRISMLVNDAYRQNNMVRIRQLSAQAAYLHQLLEDASTQACH